MAGRNLTNTKILTVLAAVSAAAFLADSMVSSSSCKSERSSVVNSCSYLYNWIERGGQREGERESGVGGGGGVDGVCRSSAANSVVNSRRYFYKIGLTEVEREREKERGWGIDGVYRAVQRLMPMAKRIPTLTLLRNLKSTVT